MWKEMKIASGFANKSNNEFAEALLQGVAGQEIMEGANPNQSSGQQRKCSQTVVGPVPCKSMSRITLFLFHFKPKCEAFNKYNNNRGAQSKLVDGDPLKKLKTISFFVESLSLEKHS